jgi:hypothetical protein
MGDETTTTKISTTFGTILIVAAFVVMLCWVALTPRPGSRQLTNLEVAEIVAPQVQAVLDAEPRFRNVKAGRYTGQDGAVSLSGFVESEADLFLLMKRIAKEQVPIAVAWQVTVLGQDD